MAQKITAYRAKDGTICNSLASAQQADAWHDAVQFLVGGGKTDVEAAQILNLLAANKQGRAVMRELLDTSERLENPNWRRGYDATRRTK